MDKNRSDQIVGCSYKDKSKNVIALVEPTDTLRTTLVRVLGPCGDLQSEKEALIFQYSKLLWKKFDRTTICRPILDTRNHLEGYTFNIDPPGCKDIDDVITIGNDGYMYITIADVASWMTVNPTLFEQANTIGQTLYDNGRVASPLLPNEAEYSLLPNQQRFGVSLKFKWDGSSISDISFEKVTLVNNESLTYEEAQTSKHANLLQAIASHLAGRQITDSHEWVEQFMIFYNCEVAKRLVEKQSGILRYQDPADVDKLAQYRTIGVDCLFLAEKSAKYISAQTPKEHWGLQKTQYCHATSPIRRFADIVNQMVLLNYSVPSVNIDLLNDLQQSIKKYEREAFFLSQILSSDSRIVSGTVLSDHRVWVPSWKRIITCKNSEPVGTHGNLKYSIDMNQSSWKRRMVFKFVNTSCQE